jgi:hypothetical protein
MAIQGNSFSLSMLMYMELFMELFMVILGGRKNREPLPLLAEKYPHTITLGECFTFVTTKFCLQRFIVDDRLTFCDLRFTSLKVDLSLNMTSSQSFLLQVRCFLQKDILFLTILSVRSGFLAAQCKGIRSLFLQMSWMERTETCDQPATSFFNSFAVLKG